MKPAKSPSFAEFIVLIAVMFSMIAFGTDAMLPALPQIAADLGLSDVNRAQLIVTSFILGTGIGQLISGPMSDALGRKPVILGGLALYALGCIVAYKVNSIEAMLAARFFQGLGVSAPRTVTIAMVRDLYAGRIMARAMSFSMVLFVLVPAVAPLIGQSIATAFGWRAIFLSFVLFALIGMVWLWLRQPETHPPERRRAVTFANYKSAIVEVMTSRIVVTYTLVLSFAYGALFGYLSSAQQVYVDVFGVGTMFPAYFALTALISGASGFLNGAVVVRLGMRALAVVAFSAALVANVVMLIVVLLSPADAAWMLPAFILWSVVNFFVPGLTFGNLNALAMEPMGHIAGMASAVFGATSTLLGVAVAVPIGLFFDGTVLPLIIGFLICSTLSLGLMLTNPKG